MISSYTLPNFHQSNSIIHLDKNRKVFHSLSLLFCISSFFFAVSVLRVIMSLNSRKLSWPFPAWSNFLNVASIWNVTSTWFYILFMIQNGEMVAALYMKYSLYSIFTTIWYLGKKEGTTGMEFYWVKLVWELWWDWDVFWSFSNWQLTICYW